MELLGKLIALCLLTAVLTLLLKRESAELSFLLTLAAVLLGIFLLLAAVDEASALCGELLELTRLSPTLFVPLVKVMAVAVTAHLTAALCKDAGQGALAVLTEIAGTVCALWCALPLLRAVVELLEGWI